MIGIIALQETTQYRNSGGKITLLGTGFLVQKRRKGRVMAFQAISDRLYILRIKENHRNISLIRIHTPIEDDTEIIKNWKKNTKRLQNLISQLVMGDCNAKVGLENI